MTEPTIYVSPAASDAPFVAELSTLNGRYKKVASPEQAQIAVLAGEDLDAVTSELSALTTTVVVSPLPPRAAGGHDHTFVPSALFEPRTERALREAFTASVRRKGLLQCHLTSHGVDTAHAQLADLLCLFESDAGHWRVLHATPAVVCAELRIEAVATALLTLEVDPEKPSACRLTMADQWQRSEIELMLGAPATPSQSTSWDERGARSARNGYANRDRETWLSLFAHLDADDHADLRETTRRHARARATSSRLLATFGCAALQGAGQDSDNPSTFGAAK